MSEESRLDGSVRLVPRRLRLAGESEHAPQEPAVSVTARQGESLEQALRVILDVAAQSLGPHSRPAGRAPIEYLPASPETDGAMGRLMAGAQHEVVDASPGDVGDDRLEIAYDNRASVLRRGVRCAFVRSPESVRCPRVRAYLRDLRRQGADVRIAAGEIPELVVVDRRVAALPVDRGPDRVIVRAPAVLSCLRAAFDTVWGSAKDLLEHERAVPERPDEVTRQVLAILAAGTIDEAGARELGMSVRTYRRHVATLLRQLGAETRFQAGVHAAQHGLL